jgi:hypothetical protein
MVNGEWVFVSFRYNAREVGREFFYWHSDASLPDALRGGWRLSVFLKAAAIAKQEGKTT